MKRFLFLSVVVTTVLGAAAAHAQGARQFAPGHQSAVPVVSSPSVVGTWFGIARLCPASGNDASHAAFCHAVCGTCASTPGTLPPELVMVSTIHADGNVTVTDAGSIPVFH